MTLFTDTFNRADGPLGDDWTVVYQTAEIASNQCHLNAQAIIKPANASASDACYAEVTVRAPSGWFQATTLRVKAEINGTYYYSVGMTGLGDHAEAVLQAKTPLGTTTVGPIISLYPMTDPVTFRITWEGGRMYLTVNGVEKSHIDDSENAALTNYFVLAGMNGADVDTYSCADVVVKTMDVTPDPLWIGGGAQQMLATGGNTEWTPGVPGSSTITADHGTISEQWTASATAIHFMYTPAEYVGAITFTESQDGLQSVVNGTVVPQEGQTPIGQLSTEAIAYIERSAIAETSPTILNRDTGIGGIQDGETLPDYFARLWHYFTGSDYAAPPYTPDNNALPDIYARLWGGEEWQGVSFAPSGTNSVAKALEALAAEMNALRTVVPYNLADVQNNLSTDWTYSIKAVYQLIEAGVPVDLQAIIDLLLSIRGSDTASIAYNELLIKGVGGVNGYSLDDVKAWVEAAQGSGLPTIKAILDYLATLKGTGTPTLTITQLAALGAQQYALNAQDDIDAIRTGSNLTLQSILDAIASIPSGDLTPVLTAIANLRGDEVSTVKAILDSLTAYRGGKPFTVQDILDAIGQDNAGPNYSTLALIALLAAALMGGSEVLAALISKLAAGKLDLLLDIVGTLISAADFFNDLWTSLKAPAPVKVSNIPAGYPGLENVVLGTPVPFTDGIVLAQRMDGALIDIATPGEHPYAIRNTQPTRYGRLGTFAFATDVQRLEAIQPIQYLNFLAVPKSIVKPTGLVVQCKQGTVGTIIPYTLPE